MTPTKTLTYENRYYLVNKEWWRVMADDTREKVETFWQNMKDSWRFAKWKVNAMVIIDILSLWKYNNDTN